MMAFNYWGYGVEHREARRGGITVYEYERGLLYVRGGFDRLLEPGHYHIWPFSYQRIVVVDMRRAAVQVANQKLLTADQVAITLNLVADYQITDLPAAMHRVNDFRGQLYEETQLAARTLMGGVAIEDLVARRAELNAELLEAVRPAAAGYGLEVLQVSIKDIILPPSVRDLLLKEVEARRLAQARLIGAREEIAALRALRNAARLLEENPRLLSLRQLELLQAFAQRPGNTVVLGGEGTPLPLRVGAPAPPPDEGQPDAGLPPG